MTFPDSKIYGANMGSIWGRQDPGGPRVGPMNFAIWVDRRRVTIWVDRRRVTRLDPSAIIRYMYVYIEVISEFHEFNPFD